MRRRRGQGAGPEGAGPYFTTSGSTGARLLVAASRTQANNASRPLTKCRRHFAPSCKRSNDHGARQVSDRASSTHRHPYHLLVRGELLRLRHEAQIGPGRPPSAGEFLLRLLVGHRRHGDDVLPLLPVHRRRHLTYRKNSRPIRVSERVCRAGRSTNELGSVVPWAVSRPVSCDHLPNRPLNHRSHAKPPGLPEHIYPSRRARGGTRGGRGTAHRARALRRRRGGAARHRPRRGAALAACTCRDRLPRRGRELHSAMATAACSSTPKRGARETDF